MFIVPSCSFKKQKIAKGDPLKRSPFECDDRLILEKQLSHKQGVPEQKIQFELQLADIPLPLDTVRLVFPDEAAGGEKSARWDKNSQFMYRSRLDQTFLSDFFSQQMEVFGWQKEEEVHAFEDTFIFSKLYKKVLISIRPCITRTSKTVIIITLINKQSDELTHRPNL